ncbi:MAG: 4Fe-4S double cluster binding domain-containing protein [Candidatus Heimdallarchaeota archaeon]
MDSEQLKGQILEWGASLVGFADMEAILPQRWKTTPFGISIAVRLSDNIMDEIETSPTLLYASHYRIVNEFLDSIALKTVNLLQSGNHQALAIPASQIVNAKDHLGDISHKMVATSAGLGWIGKNVLLVTPHFGPRVRLVSVFTDAPLRTAAPIAESNCGKCRACVVACPVKALHGTHWTTNSKRADLFEIARCYEQITHNKGLVGEQICGVCIRACPVGKSK